MKTGLNLLVASLSVLGKIIDKDANASEVFPYFAPYQEIRILESEEVLLVESGILGFAIRSTALGIQENPLNPLLGLWVLLPGVKDIQISRQNRCKIKLLREIAVTRAHGSCSLRVKGSCRNPEPAIRNARRGIQDPRLSLHMLTLYGATYFLSIQPADLECFKSVSTIYRSLFG